MRLSTISGWRRPTCFIFRRATGCAASRLGDVISAFHRPADLVRHHLQELLVSDSHCVVPEKLVELPLSWLVVQRLHCLFQVLVVEPTETIRVEEVERSLYRPLLLLRELSR